MKFNEIKIYFLSFLLLAFSAMAYGAGDVKGGKKLGKSFDYYKGQASSPKTGKVGDAYRLFINNISLPLNNIGVLAEVNYDDDGDGTIEENEGSTARYQGIGFLFSGGFFLSGKSNGVLFTNAMASASLVKDYLKGTVDGGTADPNAQLYVVKTSDAPFSQSWQDWKDAVNLGADFYDGDGDGIYNPVDLNGNGKWDQGIEDSPDLLGDETVWCVYNDALPQNQRTWNTVSPLGIEVRQTVFANSAKGVVGNIVFVRYRFKYVGLGDPNEPNKLTDVYFGVWTDTDLGGPNDDLIGSDTIRNVGMVYNDENDENNSADFGYFGDTPPCFMIDFFSGPASYIPGVTYNDINGNGIYEAGTDIPLDSALNVRGQRLGISYSPGARNMGLSSLIQYINSDPLLSDPQTATEARNLMLGFLKDGTALDPCSWNYGTVSGGVPCASVDPKFWYSGDPVTKTGWINNQASDTRLMQNMGPFELEKNQEKEVIVAYVIGRGKNNINSIEVARKVDDAAQRIFNLNFIAPAPPPAPDVLVSTGDNYIDLTWNTTEQFHWIDTTFKDYFKGFHLYAYRTNSTSETAGGETNRKLIADYQMNNFIRNVYLENEETGGMDLLYPEADSSHKLDSTFYADSSVGRIRIRITKDPFTGDDIVKGKPYYFAATSYGINYPSLVRLPKDTLPSIKTDSNYVVLITDTSLVQTVENVESIINRNNRAGIYVGEDLYHPSSITESTTNKESGFSNGEISYIVIEKNKLTGDKYSVTFAPVAAQVANDYTPPFWTLKNETTGQVLIDSSNNYDYNLEEFTGLTYEGFIPKVKLAEPKVGEPTFEPAGNRWFDTPSKELGTGVFYVGRGVPLELDDAPTYIQSSTKSTVVNYTDLRRVEIHFGEQGKAYRYLNGFKGNTFLQQNGSMTFAGSITAADTVGKGTIGMFGEGFVNVPFTAWVVDPQYQESKQLAVAFLEKRANFGNNPTPYPPDGLWDPKDSIQKTIESIIVFNEDYDPNGTQIQYTGGVGTNGAELVRGYTLNDPNATDEQKAIAKSPWFNALYVVSLQKPAINTEIKSGTFTIPIAVHPYTENDKYVFNTSENGAMSDDQQKTLFQKVNVFPNPLFGYNVGTSYTNSPSDEPYVTFSNLPNEITIKIYSLSGSLLRTLTTNDKTSPTSPFLNWNLQNESGLRVASGLYIAIVSSPKYGDKVLKFSIIMPQKQIQKY